MNKGFELIEACRLFNVTPKKVEVLVHRQSIIHSMVEYTDGAVIAEDSYPDMRDCVRYALTYPDRAPFGGEPLYFAKIGTLTFAHPDTEAFPLLTPRATRGMPAELPPQLLSQPTKKPLTRSSAAG